MKKRKKPLLIRAVEQHADGKASERTINAADVRPAEHPVHGTLPDDLRHRAEALYERIGRLARPGLHFEGWVDQFRFDQHPEDEVRIWEHIAEVFERTGGADLSGERQRQTLRAILLISMMGVDIESQTGLSEGEVRRLRQAYDQP